jgi:hypothetical protein
MLWALQRPEPLTSAEAFTLMILGNYANDDGSSCYPSMQTVARQVRVSRVTVYRILDRLEHVHHLIVKEKSGKAGGRSNRYRLRITDGPRLPAELPEGSPMDPPVHVVPNLFEPEGVYHGDTPSDAKVIHMVSRQARQGVLHGDTPPVSRGDTGVSRQVIHPGVSSSETQPVNYPSGKVSACASSHDEPCGAGVEGCTLFVVDDSTAEIGRSHIEALRQQLAHAGSES